MTWLLLRKLWMVPVIAAFLGLIWWQGLSLNKVQNDRDAWKKSALAYQVSAGEWEASFRQAEKARQDEQKASVRAVNDSEAYCDTRVAKARSSAVKIDKVVNSVQPICKPGESLPRVLADPRALSDAISGVQ